MKAAWGATADLMLLELERLGRATRAELQEYAGVDRNIAGSIISRMMKVSLRGPYAGERRIHICGWTRECGEHRSYLRAVYAPGDKRDAPKPPAKKRGDIVRDMAKRSAERRERTKPGRDLHNAWASGG